MDDFSAGLCEKKLRSSFGRWESLQLPSWVRPSDSKGWWFEIMPRTQENILLRGTNFNGHLSLLSV
jgi:hypothetical protein